jgi:hypothetical protein
MAQIEGNTHIEKKPRRPKHSRLTVEEQLRLETENIHFSLNLIRQYKSIAELLNLTVDPTLEDRIRELTTKQRSIRDIVRYQKDKEKEELDEPEIPQSSV